VAKIPTIELRPNPRKVRKRRKRREVRTRKRRERSTRAAPGPGGYVVEIVAKRGRGLHFSYLAKGKKRVESRASGEHFRKEIDAKKRAFMFLNTLPVPAGVIGARVIPA